MGGDGSNARVPVWQRLLLGAALSLGLALLAFAVGAFVAARCCVPPGSGLAGPGIVAGYGILSAIGGFFIGAFLSMKLGRKALGIGSAIAGTGGAIVLALFTLALIQYNKESAQALDEAYERLPVFELTLTLSDGEPFARFEASWAERESLVVERGQPACRRSLDGAQAVQLLESLRAVEGVLLQSPAPCAEDPAGTPVQTLRFQVTEARPPHTSADLLITEACLARHAGLGAPLEAAQRVARSRGKCLPELPWAQQPRE